MKLQHYFEFRENEYYALITVEVDTNDLKIQPYKKATEIYVEVVGGYSVEEVLDEAQPILITKELAFRKYMNCPSFEDETVKKAIQDFEEMKNGVLLIDGSLI